MENHKLLLKRNINKVIIQQFTSLQQCITVLKLILMLKDLQYLITLVQGRGDANQTEYL